MIMGEVEILPAAPVALRLPQQGPSASLVTGAQELLRIQQTLRHQNPVPIEIRPILAEPLQAQLHQPARQIGLVPTFQNQESAVVGHQRQTPLLLRAIPANPLLDRKSTRLNSSHANISY